MSLPSHTDIIIRRVVGTELRDHNKWTASIIRAGAAERIKSLPCCNYTRHAANSATVVRSPRHCSEWTKEIVKEETKRVFILARSGIQRR
jgi:hypothetical protein